MLILEPKGSKTENVMVVTSLLLWAIKPTIGLYSKFVSAYRNSHIDFLS